MKTPIETNVPKTEVKDAPKHYDPIQERAPDRDVTKADKKPLSRREDINKQMQDNKDWIAKNPDDIDGIHKREAANAELTHRLIDMDVAGRDVGRKLESLKG